MTNRTVLWRSQSSAERPDTRVLHVNRAAS